MPNSRLRGAGLALAFAACLHPGGAFAQGHAPASPPNPDAAPAASASAPVPSAAPVQSAAPTQPPAPAQPAASTQPIAPAPPPVVIVPTPVPESETANPSPWAMFLHADLVVKAVMVGLVFASVVVWTIWLVKGAALLGATLRARRAVRALGEAEGLGAETGAAWSRSRPVRAMVEVARDEVERSAALPADGVKERAALAVQRIEARAAREMARGTGLIATIGATAPFVGLFGTVWGIMDSFVGITRAHTSNLAVVAPGIAEALLATAIGLVAAIPAVVIFNGFARATAGYRALLGDASAEVMRHLSRDLDRRDAGRPSRGYQAAE